MKKIICILLTASLAFVSCGKDDTPSIAVDTVRLDKQQLTLTREASETLTATVAPDNAAEKRIVWSSDKPEIAAVDETGVVTGVAPGTATITAAAGGKSAVCTVTVEPDVYVVVNAMDQTSKVQSSYLWKNGEATELPMNYSSEVFVYEGDVYVVGETYNPTFVMLWKNGSATRLYDEEGFFFKMTSLFVYEGEVYATGSCLDPKGSSGRLWKDNTWIRLDPENKGRYECVYVDRGDVYVAGVNTNTFPKEEALVYWKNGVEHELYRVENMLGIPYSIIVKNGTVYTVGIIYDRNNSGIDNRHGMLWINDTPHDLTGVVFPYDLKVTDSGDIYIAGTYYENSMPQVVLLKNNERTVLDTDGVGSSLFVYGDDVYVAGASGEHAALWKNGRKTVIPEGYNAVSVFVY